MKTQALERCAAVFGCGRKSGNEHGKIGDACEAKEEYMISNGALLLQKQISTGHGKGSGSDPLRIFSAREIERATNTYDDQLILGRKVATGYKGSLEDGRVVAIKSPGILPPSEWNIDFFLNQVVIKQIIHHKNVIKLYGCCLETRVPTLVYEFIPNGTLSDQIYGQHHGGNSIPSFNIPWSRLVRILYETSHALSYMHFALPKPIVHMDVKPTSIYLDESFNGKLTNFGHSVSISPGEDFISEAVVGTHGYIDPEYQESRRVTEKCDVYGFGVTLLESLTGKSPRTILAKRCNLVDYFIRCSEQPDGVLEIVHPRVLREAAKEEIHAFAGLARRCIASSGGKRPTMREVAIELRRINFAVRQRFDEIEHNSKGRDNIDLTSKQVRGVSC